MGPPILTYGKGTTGKAKPGVIPGRKATGPDLKAGLPGCLKTKPEAIPGRKATGPLVGGWMAGLPSKAKPRVTVGRKATGPHVERIAGSASLRQTGSNPGTESHGSAQ